MPTFSYQGRNQDGKLVDGKMEAHAADAVAEVLLQQNITPIHITLVSVKTNVIEKLNHSFQRKVKTDELVLFCRQMYTLVRAGVPIMKSLTRVADTTQSPVLANALKRIIELIAEGKTLTAAMRTQPFVFNAVFISIIHAGENSGQLEEAFLQLSNYLELEAKTISRVKSASRYPLIVIVTLIIAIFVINFMVVPAFANMFSHFGAELPLPTRILIGTSNFLLRAWPYILLFFIFTVIGIRYALAKNERFRYHWDGAKLKIPAFGDIVKRVILARFARTFTMITRTGVPVVDGVGLVANAVGNAFIQKHILEMRDSIEQGETLSQAAVDTELFSPLVLQMLSVGEETGNIDEMLAQVADFYEREVDYDLARLGDLIEPILLVVLGGMVLVLALGVFLPIWDMANLARR